MFDKLLENATIELSKAIQFLDTDNSPAQTFAQFTSSLIKDIQSNEELSDYFLLITRCMLEGTTLPMMEELRKADLSLFENAAKLIEKGQRMGEFKQGNPYKLSLLYFSIIQGVANMKLFMGDQYVSQEVEDILGFLLE